MNLREIAQRLNLLKEYIESISVVNEAELKDPDRVKNPNYTLLEILQSVENDKSKNYSLKLYFKQANIFRYIIFGDVKRDKVIENTINAIGSLITKNSKYSNVEVKKISRGYVCGNTKLDENFSTGGGLEVKEVKKDGTEDAYAVEFELENSSRTESAINTKLREITPCIVYELFKGNKDELDKIIANPESEFDTGINVQQAILSANTNSDSIKKLFSGDKKDPEKIAQILNTCYTFDFKDDNYRFRRLAYIDGIKTLEYAIHYAETRDPPLELDYIEYTGLATMAGGSEGGSEDIKLHFRKLKPENDENGNPQYDYDEIDVSLKSGKYKSREFTFESLLALVNAFDEGTSPEQAIDNNDGDDNTNKMGQTGAINGKAEYGIKLLAPEDGDTLEIKNKTTLYIPCTVDKRKGKKRDIDKLVIKDSPDEIATKYFELIANVPPALLAKTLKYMIYPDVKNAPPKPGKTPPDKDAPYKLKVWNVKDFKNNETITRSVGDITDVYTALSVFDTATISTEDGNRIIFKNENDEVNNYFRIRWYKRSGVNQLGKYKLIVEPAPAASRSKKKSK